MKTAKKDFLHLPAKALEEANFTPEDQLTILSGPSMLLVVKRELTTMDLVNLASQLDQLATVYTKMLAELCGECDDCNGDGCPFDPNCEDITLPDFLREEAGIPKDAKLCADVDEEKGTVTIWAADHQHDLSDVPKPFLDRLICMGVCLGELEERLIIDHTVHTY
jgi:bifunctional DNA-binding transcriptional regulator/antitoxin component of YhaV-PrlF toxin-antitoxin module